MGLVPAGPGRDTEWSLSIISLQTKAIWQLWFVAQIFHLFPASAKFDGMKFSLLAQAIHPIPASVKSDGMKFGLLAQTIHQLSALAKYGWCGNLFA